MSSEVGMIHSDPDWSQYRLKVPLIIFLCFYRECRVFKTRGLVWLRTIFSIPISATGCGGAAVYFAPSQEDSYLSLCKDFKSIACSVQELWCSKVGVENCDAAAGH
jgi:hypothetical protein